MAESSERVSDITVEDIASYIRLTDIIEDDDNYKFILKCLTVAKSYIRSYTGVEDLDEIPEFVICVYLLCQDMYDNRSRYIDGNPQPNKTFDTILDLHNGNLI